MSLYYYKDMFKVQDLEQAKNIILTEEQQGGDYRQRWERETEYMKTLFAGGLGDLSGKTVLDFGCGIGRLSKALLEQYGCRVLGVDISPDMRRMAAEYVNSDRFSVISYEMFCALAERGGLKADCAIAVYVLQHVFDPAHDIKLLSRAVADKLLVLNLKHRAVPVIDSENGRKKFYIDEQPEASADVAALLEQQFTALSELELAAEKISVVTKHWCRVYGKKTGQ